jgi:hypothetical protein
MKILLKYWHWLVIAVLALLVVMLYQHNKEQAMVIASKNSIIREQNTEIEYRKNKEGKTIADKVAAEARAKDLESAYPKLAKVLTDHMDIRIKNLQTAMQAEFRAINTGQTVIIRDTVERDGRKAAIDSVKINDGFLAFRGEIEPHIFRWEYSYQDSITIALHTKRKWFLGKQTLYSSLMLSNPNAKVTNSTSVQVKEFKDKRWVISVGPYYDPFRDQWGASINAGYALFKF